MNLRPRHLVCMLLLLSALRAAEGSALPELRFTEHNLRAFLLQDAAPTHNVASEQDHTGPGYLAPSARLVAPVMRPLTPASTTALREAWSMRPPAAHCARLHSVTARA